MSRALQLAKRGRYTCDPNPRVGCVIARDGIILGEGWHHKAGEAHAEINAINSANNNISRSTFYITLEPCSHHGRTPPCAEALISNEIKEVIIAMIDPNPLIAGKGIKLLTDKGINVRDGLLAEQALGLNKGFIKRMETGLPYIRCKLAMSLDGRTALANGNSQWISGEASRRDVHRLRAASSAIVTSADSIIKDDSLLTVRDFDGNIKQPLRVIIDRQAKTSASASMFLQPGKTIIYSQISSSIKHEKVETICIKDQEDWLQNVFRNLAAEYQINEVLVECGGRLSAALIESKLLDELIVYVAPKILGSDAQAMTNIVGIESLENSYSLTLIDTRQIGSDIRLTYQLGV